MVSSDFARWLEVSGIRWEHRLRQHACRRRRLLLPLSAEPPGGRGKGYLKYRGPPFGLCQRWPCSSARGYAVESATRLCLRRTLDSGRRVDRVLPPTSGFRALRVRVGPHRSGADGPSSTRPGRARPRLRASTCNRPNRPCALCTYLRSGVPRSVGPMKSTFLPFSRPLPSNLPDSLHPLHLLLCLRVCVYALVCSQDAVHRRRNAVCQAKLRVCAGGRATGSKA